MKRIKVLMEITLEYPEDMLDDEAIAIHTRDRKTGHINMKRDLVDLIEGRPMNTRAEIVAINDNVLGEEYEWKRTLN